MEKKTGNLIIISAPSGAGKTTICKAVLNRFRNMEFSVSHTTRKLRGSEKEGIDYHFISEAKFNKKTKNGEWAEWAKVHGNYYGTSAKLLDNGLALGKNILLDIDVQGAKQIIKKYPNSILVFIMPPSLSVLKKRLEQRAVDSSEVIKSRIKNAKQEIMHKDFYNHCIVNDSLDFAVDELVAILEKYNG